MSNRFDWQSQLTKAYTTFPEAPYKPVIGITGNYGELTCKLGEGYYKSILKAGGVPVIIPPLGDTDCIINTLEHIDGLLLSGGADFNPLYAGEEPQSKLSSINSERDLPELLITQLAYNRQIPILGICRGIQTIAMTLGGQVMQDISETAHIKHSQDADRSEPTHSVNIVEGSILSSLYEEQHIYVNSFHHQAVGDTGQRFRVTARSADGLIEAIESTEHKSIMGVQWHPECLSEGLPIFQWLIREAAQYRKVCDVHQRILTLDTHCDTPMFFDLKVQSDKVERFPQNVNFIHRDPKILVDMHKMTEGHQDATIMVAYLPQPTDHPKEYADNIFDQIEQMVATSSQYVGIARTPDDLWINKHLGKKSIMLGIENGHALDGQIENLRHFAKRGIVYMTLCHNGDNDICDSARGSQTWGGVSAFGKQVIQEMNHLGILVDLSHAHEKSFYDALELSQTPIVCSHSSCRALCDHPRNLTDDQMRALAAKGGVMQVTLYNGFLVKDGQATIEDAMRHLEHAIDIMGIDHVGLGTDFDGDGGIIGLASSSELTNFTRQLLKRQFSEQDIQKIWGGNFLRVMKQVQEARKQ